MHVEPPGAVFTTVILFFFVIFLQKKKGRKLGDYHHKIKSLWLRIPTRKHKHTCAHTYTHKRSHTLTHTFTIVLRQKLHTSSLSKVKSTKLYYKIKQSLSPVKIMSPVLGDNCIYYIRLTAEGVILNTQLFFSLLGPFKSLCLPGA